MREVNYCALVISVLAIGLPGASCGSSGAPDGGGSAGSDGVPGKAGGNASSPSSTAKGLGGAPSGAASTKGAGAIQDGSQPAGGGPAAGFRDAGSGGKESSLGAAGNGRPDAGGGAGQSDAGDGMGGAHRTTGDSGRDGVGGRPRQAGEGSGAGAASGVGGRAGGSGSTDIPDSSAGAAAGPERCTGRTAIDTTRWDLVWSDEFDRPGAPNSANWGFETGFVRNEELQWYQSDNAAVADGRLTITAKKERVQNKSYKAGSSDWKQSRQYAEYTSSSLRTMGKQSFLFGRFEICARIDTRKGSWPAFWVLGDGKSWPSSGEVDIMEFYNNGVKANVCIPSGSTCDWKGSVSQSLSTLGGSSWADDYHLWAMDWDSKDIRLTLDDQLVYDYKIPSTSPYVGNNFYILVNLAIGANGGDPSGTTFPILYEVDYVRVYKAQ